MTVERLRERVLELISESLKAGLHADCIVNILEGCTEGLKHDALDALSRAFFKQA